MSCASLERQRAQATFFRTKKDSCRSVADARARVVEYSVMWWGWWCDVVYIAGAAERASDFLCIHTSACLTNVRGIRISTKEKKTDGVSLSLIHI